MYRLIREVTGVILAIVCFGVLELFYKCGEQMKWFGVMKYRPALLLRQHKFSDLDRNAFVKRTEAY